MFEHLTRALRHRNYRLFFGGQTVSLIGTWITRIATSWLVYRLTGSELLLGVVGFAGRIHVQKMICGLLHPCLEYRLLLSRYFSTLKSLYGSNGRRCLYT